MRVLGLSCRGWLKRFRPVNPDSGKEPVIWHAFFYHEWKQDRGTRAPSEKMNRYIAQDLQCSITGVVLPSNRPEWSWSLKT
jgi:hypothetical protein